MQRLYLSRRNLLTLLSKLDRVRAGGISERTLVKLDPDNHDVWVTAIEDAEAYADRKPGVVFPADDPNKNNN